MSGRWGSLLLLASLSASASEVFAPSDIPLLDHRFRIDHGVKEITFIIERKPGTPSVILVRPDGSKLYAGRATPPEVGWLALPQQDLVTVRDPMPGPWQAIGEVEPASRVRLLSDIRLESAPLPTRLYQGERVKLSARLLAGGAAAEAAYYLSELGMRVSLQPSADGESAMQATLGHYLDDGKGLDEAPGDGVMTAEAVLDVPAGRYRALYSTTNQVFTRATSQAVAVLPLPLSQRLTPPADERGARLSLLVDEAELDPASVAVQGEVVGGDAKRSPFHGAASGPVLDIPLPTPREAGRYEVQTTLFGTTRAGREIRLQLPVTSFSVLSPLPPPSPVVPHETEAPRSWWRWVLAGGLAILSGAGTFILWRRRRARQAALAQQERGERVAMPPLDLNLPGQ